MSRLEIILLCIYLLIGLGNAIGGYMKPYKDRSQIIFNFIADVIMWPFCFGIKISK